MGFYENNNLASIPFVNLLDDNYTISTKFFGKIFTILGKDCEPLQIIDDYKNLIKIHQTFQSNVVSNKLDVTGDWGALVMREYGDMMEEVGPAIEELNQKKRMDKVPYDTQKLLTDYYRKMYYLKFQRLSNKFKINPPVSLRKRDVKRLMQLDHLQNLEELGIHTDYEQQLKKLLANDFSVEYYQGFHNVARSYLKTLQWVIYYYLSPSGVPQWDWEYPYPFTPLCSDMGVYCQLYDSKQVLA